MGNNPLVSAALRGMVMQGLMVVLGRFVPAIGQMPNFYAIAGTILSVLTGAIFSRMAPPQAGSGQAALGGALAGGSSSVVGGLLAVLAGQWPGFQVLQLLFPAISGGIGGGLGGVLGRAMKARSLT